MTADGYFCCHIFIGEKMIKTIKNIKPLICLYSHFLFCF